MKRRLVVILLSVVVLILLFSESMLSVCATTTKTKEQAIAWLDDLVGTKVGSGQCVALIKAYYEYLGAPTPYGNGCDYATNSLPSGWQRIKGATPQIGDILVWTEGDENYGHVAICGGNDVYYHQNWSGYYVQVLNKSYTGGFSVSSGKYYANYWGVIRPDFKKDSSTVISYENITSGNYFIRNKANNSYLNISYSKDEDLATIDTTTFGNYDAQVYNIYKVDDGYEMMPLCSQTRVVNPYCWTVESGKTVNLYSKTYESSQWWKFQPVGDGYVIRNVQNPTVCITPSSSGMIVSEYTGSDSQIWYLEKACIITYDANGGSGAPASQRVRAGYKTVLSSEKPTRDKYTFLGWSTDKDSTVAAWNEKTTVTIYDNTTVYAVWQLNYILGDSDKDGKVTTGDLALVKLHLAGIEEFDSISVAAADLDSDGVVTTTDLATLKLHLAGVVMLE